MSTHVVFKWSMVLYVILLVYTFGSLSVPPADLGFFVAMAVLAGCALMASKGEPRSWKAICSIFFAIAVLGTICEIVSGCIIRRGLPHDTNLPGHCERQTAFPVPAQGPALTEVGRKGVRPSIMALTELTKDGWAANMAGDGATGSD